MRGVPVETLMNSRLGYAENAERIESLVRQGRLEPVKSSGLNGKRPALYQRYVCCRPKRDKAAWIQRVDQLIEPPLSAAFYKSHLVQFEKDEPVIKALQAWLNDHPDESELECISLNERSFEIFGQEKLLGSTGLRVLGNLKVDPERLCFYTTDIPLSVWSLSRKKGNILIVENLDPFVSIRSLLMEGQKTILGFPVNTIGYGAGHGIERSFRDLLVFGDPVLRESLETVYYWGDLDYEGIRIFESLHEKYPDVSIVPWMAGYQTMLEEGKKVALPQSNDRQHACTGSLFFSYFDKSFCKEVGTLLEEGLYIPQEILSRKQYLQGKMERRKKHEF